MNTMIFNRLSVVRKDTDINTRPLFLTSSQFAQKDYGKCLDNYKRRLEVEGPQDLYSLVNVTMSPWSTDGEFLSELVTSFRDVVQQEAEVSCLSLLKQIRVVEYTETKLYSTKL